MSSPEEYKQMKNIPELPDDLPPGSVFWYTPDGKLPIVLVFTFVAFSGALAGALVVALLWWLS